MRHACYAVACKTPMIVHGARKRTCLRHSVLGRTEQALSVPDLPVRNDDACSWRSAFLQPDLARVAQVRSMHHRVHACSRARELSCAVWARRCKSQFLQKARGTVRSRAAFHTRHIRTDNLSPLHCRQEVGAEWQRCRKMDRCSAGDLTSRALWPRPCTWFVRPLWH